MIRKDYRIAIIIWFVWPYTVVREAYQEIRHGRRGAVRLALGCVMVMICFDLWTRLIVLLVVTLVGWEPLGYVVALVVGFMATPFVGALVLPLRHNS